MDTATRVPIREYVRNYKLYNEQVNQSGESIIITNQDTDVVSLNPVKSQKRLWTEKDFEKMRFDGGPDLSNNIDEIVYGI